MDRRKRSAGAPDDEIRFSSTEVQNRFGEVLRIVQEGTRVVVERRGRQEAVILPVAEYRDLERKARSPLLELERRFDSMVARMSEDGALQALDRALDSGPEALSIRIPPAHD